MIKYSELNLGQIEAIANKLGGMNGIQRLLAGELAVVEASSLQVVTHAPTSSLVPNWAAVYEALGMAAEYVEFTKQFFVQETPGFWTIPMVKAEEPRQENEEVSYKLTCNKVVAALRKAGCNVYLYYDDLDADVTENDRDPNRDGSYCVSFRAEVEADSENKNQSADGRREAGYKDITLLERLLLELAYFLTTGKHLDVKNVTLCSGSRDRSGYVPYVDWRAGRRGVHVDWDRSDIRDVGLRARSVVSCSAKPREATQVASEAEQA